MPEVEAFWHEVLPDEDFLMRPRMSRILYRGKLFDYPLKPFNALCGLGVLEAVRCVLSYALVRVRPPKDQSNFEGWVAARFGWRLYRIFFKTYTEKVWGVPGRPRSRPTGRRSGSRTCRCCNAVTSALRPGRGKDQITTPDRGVPVPAAGPRDDVGALPATSCSSDGGEVRMHRPPVTAVHARRRPGARRRAGRRHARPAAPPR